MKKKQGDQIGRNFAVWATFFMPNFFLHFHQTKRILSMVCCRYFKGSDGIWCRCFGLSKLALIEVFWHFWAWQLFWLLFPKFGQFFSIFWPLWEKLTILHSIFIRKKLAFFKTWTCKSCERFWRIWPGFLFFFILFVWNFNF